MTEKAKDRPGRHQEALNSSERTGGYVQLRRRFKSVLVTLAVWGAIPVPVADWIIRFGGLRDA